MPITGHSRRYGFAALLGSIAVVLIALSVSTLLPAVDQEGGTQQAGEREQEGLDLVLGVLSSAKQPGDGISKQSILEVVEELGKRSASQFVDARVDRSGQLAEFSAPLRPGTEIRLPKGRLIAGGFLHRTILPDSVSLSGKGTTETLLVVNPNEFSTLRHLAISNMAIVIESQQPERLEPGDMVCLRLQNVWLLNTASLPVFNTGEKTENHDGGALLAAKNCDFMGLDPALLDTQPLVGSFEDCRFFKFENALTDQRTGERIWFDQCVFDSPSAMGLHWNLTASQIEPGATTQIPELLRSGPGNVTLHDARTTNSSAVSSDLPSRGTVSLAARRQDAYGGSAYSFRFGSKDPKVHQNRVDLVFANGGLYVNHPGTSNSIADMGIRPLEQIKKAPRSLSNRPVLAVKGHSYILKITCQEVTCSIKLRVTGVSDQLLELDWQLMDPATGIPQFRAPPMPQTTFVAIPRRAGETDDSQEIRETLSTKSVDQLLAMSHGIKKVLGEKLLQPAAEITTAYAKFLAQHSDAGINRILERGKFNGLVPGREGGAYFSFTHRKNDYNISPDLELSAGRFTTGFAGGDCGVVLRIQGKDIRSVRLADVARELVLADPNSIRSGTNPLWRRNSGQARAEQGVLYVVRSIRWDESDLIAAFQVVQKDKHGVTFVWRVLDWRDVPKRR